MKVKTPGKLGWIVAGVSAALALALPYLLHPEHHGEPPAWDEIPGWWAGFGALGCAVIIIFSKWLGAWFLQRPEDWYESAEREEK